MATRESKAQKETVERGITVTRPYLQNLHLPPILDKLGLTGISRNLIKHSAKRGV
jgi:hypothetical protein